MTGLAAEASWNKREQTIAVLKDTEAFVHVHDLCWHWGSLSPLYPPRSTVAINLLADACNARARLRIMLNVGDFSPLSSWVMYVR